MQSFIYLVLCLAAFGLASLAVQSWRELSICAVLTTLAYWPVKWIAAGTWLGGDSLSFTHPTDGPAWKLSFSPSGAFAIAVIIAAVAMILARHFKIVAEEKKAQSKSK